MLRRTKNIATGLALLTLTFAWIIFLILLYQAIMT
jgi:hypothetical protein